MDAHVSQSDSESSALLATRANAANIRGHLLPKADLAAVQVLPVALLAALAMACTAATSYFAYASLLCDDPRRCQGDESSRFASLVAITTWGPNVIGISALGFLQRLVIHDRKRGLVIWVMCRSMSVVTLLLGVFAKNIYVALSGRVFEGLASDNLLHFALNAVYTQCHEGQAASMIGYSLGLYMVGISISPFMAGLFKDFVTSFLISLGLFGTTVVYLQLSASSLSSVQTSVDRIDAHAFTSDLLVDPHARQGYSPTILEPLQVFYRNLRQLPIGLCLFFYNTIQSYVFSALLVHTSVHFHFTSKENGIVISIAHSVAALYIFATSLVLPWLSRRTGHIISQDNEIAAAKSRYLVFALASLAIQSLALSILPFANKAWQIYCATVLLAFGLPTPSYLKSYSTAQHSDEMKVKILAGLAVMETLGSVLGPMGLGIVQSVSLVDGSVFFTAASLGLLAILSLSTNFFMK